MTVEIDPAEQRRRLKAFWKRYDYAVAERRRLLRSDEAEQYRSAYYDAYGELPPLPVLPEYPEFPPECFDMICGAWGRQRQRPCQSKQIERNGRCKFHGGASTGPKTPEGKARSVANLRRSK